MCFCNIATKTADSDTELIDVLTAISTVSMRLAVMLEMLAGKNGAGKSIENIKQDRGVTHEIV